jgi:hypothetical protein
MKFNVQLMEWMDRMGGGDGSKVKKGSSFGSKSNTPLPSPGAGVGRCTLESS